MSISSKARDFKRRERDILKVALDCFSGEDWESVTVSRIAERAGIAKGTMYLHFDSKQEIFARLTLDFYYALLEHLKHYTSGDNCCLLTLLNQAFRFYLEKPEYRCVTQYCERDDFKHNLNPELNAEFTDLEQSLYSLIRQELERGIKSGWYRPVPIAQTILGLQCTFHGALNALWRDSHGEPDNPDQFISDIIHYMLAPLAATPGDSINKNKKTFSVNPEPADSRYTLECSHE